MHERVIVQSNAGDVFVNRDRPKEIFAKAVQSVPKNKPLFACLMMPEAKGALLYIGNLSFQRPCLWTFETWST